MLKDEKRVVQEHTRAAIAHDLSDFLFLFE